MTIGCIRCTASVYLVCVYVCMCVCVCTCEMHGIAVLAGGARARSARVRRVRAYARARAHFGAQDLRIFARARIFRAHFRAQDFRARIFRAHFRAHFRAQESHRKWAAGARGRGRGRGLRADPLYTVESEVGDRKWTSILRFCNRGWRPKAWQPEIAAAVRPRASGSVAHPGAVAPCRADSGAKRVLGTSAV